MPDQPHVSKFIYMCKIKAYALQAQVNKVVEEELRRYEIITAKQYKNRRGRKKKKSISTKWKCFFV
ncbi:hypothetical protein GCM10008022_38350 [Paenibacillus hunanensis]|nr:hypothetical protein GCM10008022_38350 [Paenibacillus hunanensis]